MRKIILKLGILALGLLLALACRATPFLEIAPTQTPGPPPESTSPLPSPPASTELSPTAGALATPAALEPAAGICAEFPGEVVTVTIYADIPDPRCTIVRPEQRLRVVNAQQEEIEISLAGLPARLEPGATHEFSQPFGSLLAPGVHYVEVSPCCGAALWLSPPDQQAPVPSQTPSEGLAPGAISPGGILPPYLDDRSGPEELIRSLYNAINRREYARAYDYWETNAPKPDYTQFRQGFADTARVEATTGAVGSDAGAGQVYYSVPVYLVAYHSGGGSQTYAGCYILHLSNPASQVTPPFRPLQISNAEVLSDTSQADPQDLLAHGCDRLAPGAHILAPQPEFEPGEIGPDRYLDNSSGPLEVLRSLFNAINRREFLRAYSYWSFPAEQEAFGRFEQGYANTQSVALTAGAPLSSESGGVLSYQVPVTLVAQTTEGATQTYVGCYSLRQPAPELQSAPPFQPLQVVSAEVQQVLNDANTVPLMIAACPGF